MNRVEYLLETIKLTMVIFAPAIITLVCMLLFASLVSGLYMITGWLISVLFG